MRQNQNTFQDAMNDAEDQAMRFPEKDKKQERKTDQFTVESDKRFLQFCLFSCQTEKEGEKQVFNHFVWYFVYYIHMAFNEKTKKGDAKPNPSLEEQDSWK